MQYIWIKNLYNVNSSVLTLKLPGVRSKFKTKFYFIFLLKLYNFCRCFQWQSTHTVSKEKCKNLEYQKKSAFGIFLSFKFKGRAIWPSPGSFRVKRSYVRITPMAKIGRKIYVTSICDWVWHATWLFFIQDLCISYLKIPSS